MTTPAPDQELRRVICDTCGARALLKPGEDRPCADCGGQFRPMMFLEGLVDRWFAPNDQRVSELYPRHLKLIELMWTGQGRGRETYEALNIDRISYSQFVTRATEVVVKGLAEGWIEASIPAAPVQDDSLYAVRFLDPARWADELVRAFDANAEGLAKLEQVRIDREGDPDIV